MRSIYDLVFVLWYSYYFKASTVRRLEDWDTGAIFSTDIREAMIEP